jgi:hypothetical protein
LNLLMSSEKNYDYVFSMDCDSLFIDLSMEIEDMINLYADENAHLLISEDGRGLSGGNWIIKNTEWSRNLLRTAYEMPIYDKYDLKDQFSLLWLLLRPSVSMDENDVLLTWGGLGYDPHVRLIPQGLINAYPWMLCRPSHHCFEDGKDSIVSFISLGSQSKEMAFNLLFGFAEERLFHGEKKQSYYIS